MQNKWNGVTVKFNNRVDKDHCSKKINVKITKSRANFKY